MSSSDGLVRGWKMILAVLGVSEKTARGYSRRPKDKKPLRLMWDNVGVYIGQAELNAWKADHTMSYAEHCDQLEQERLQRAS